jgi:phosphonate transport system permease protein
MENPLTNKNRLWNIAVLLAAAALYVWAWRGTEMQWRNLGQSLPRALDFLGRMFPPTGTTADLTDQWLPALMKTIQMGLLGTTIGALVSLPLGVMAARNLSPCWLTVLTRGLLNVIRTVPSVVWGLFFVAAIGLGPAAGVLALSVYTVGYLGKFYFETFESLDDAAAAALRLAGASQPQIFQYAILPQALPLLANYTLFIFEYSIRAATILGVVGAGGIGYYFQVYLGNFDYQRAASLLLLLLAVVITLDWLSGQARRRLLAGNAPQPATS